MRTKQHDLDVDFEHIRSFDQRKWSVRLVGIGKTPVAYMFWPVLAKQLVVERWGNSGRCIFYRIPRGPCGRVVLGDDILGVATDGNESAGELRTLTLECLPWDGGTSYVVPRHDSELQFAPVLPEVPRHMPIIADMLRDATSYMREDVLWLLTRAIERSVVPCLVGLAKLDLPEISRHDALDQFWGFTRWLEAYCDTQYYHELRRFGPVTSAVSGVSCHNKYSTDFTNLAIPMLAILKAIRNARGSSACPMFSIAWNYWDEVRRRHRGSTHQFWESDYDPRSLIMHWGD